jgi:hypothetical protein
LRNWMRKKEKEMKKREKIWFWASGVHPL